MFPLEEVEFHRYFTTVARNMKMIFDQNLGIKLVNYNYSNCSFICYALKKNQSLIWRINHFNLILHLLIKWRVIGLMNDDAHDFPEWPSVFSIKKYLCYYWNKINDYLIRYENNSYNNRENMQF